ncbi:MAG TPA: phage holin family protein [Phycisphaerales bacterium]|nr:phage holin family protein [Phycisphaerales bacterium]
MADYGKDNFGGVGSGPKGGSKDNFEPTRGDRVYPERGPDIGAGAGQERLIDTGGTGAIGSSVAGTGAQSCPVDYSGGTSTMNSGSTGTFGGSTAYEAQGRSRAGDTDYGAAPSRTGFSGSTTGVGGYTRPQSIPAMLKELTTGMGSLLRNEVALAKAEMREKASVFTKNAVSVAVGGVIALAGSIILLHAFVAALSSIFDAADVSPRVYSWLSPLIVSLVVLGVAGLLIKKGLDRIKCASLTPERTAQSLKETGEWVKEKVS